MNDRDETDLSEDQLAAMWHEGTPAELARDQRVEVAQSPLLWQPSSSAQGAILAITQVENMAVTQLRRQLVH